MNASCGQTSLVAVVDGLASFVPDEIGPVESDLTKVPQNTTAQLVDVWKGREG